MKKVLVLLLTLALVFTMAACAAEEPAPTPAPTETPTETPAEGPAVAEKIGVTVPAFAVMVNDVEITQDAMADYALYEVTAHSINSSGTESTVVYVGFMLKDVLAAAGVTDFSTVAGIADDGYTVELSGEVAGQDSTLFAVTKDGEQFSAAPWLAPCSSETTGDYLKSVVGISVDGAEVGQAAAPEEAPAEGGVPEIADRTDKVEFAPYSFLVNGAEVTNDTLAGQSIFKIEPTVTNKSGESATSQYTGYKLADVLAACGITDYTVVKVVANDGYTTELDKETADSEYTLVAIEKDKELGEDGTIWVAPCLMPSSSDYSKLVVEIIAE